MKKFYHKKDLAVEESPLTLQLQRRHTVVEGDKDNAKVVTKLKPVCRSNSTSSIYRPPMTAKNLSSQKGFLESTLSANSSGSSAASTVVITECQLSSSWLYNNKKAQMCPKSPKESLSAGESSSQQASDNKESKLPTIHRPKVKSVSSQNSRSRKCSSCCCYTAIVMLAGFAILGIMSTIAGIVYMEFFTGSNRTQAQGQTAIDQSENLSYTKKIGQVIGENHSPQDLMSSSGTRDSTLEPSQKLETLNHFKDLSNENTRKNKESGNILRVKKVKKVVIPATETDITITSFVTQHEEQSPEESNKKQSILQVESLSLDAQKNSPYSKLFELYKDIHTNKSSNILQEPSNFEEDKLNTKITDVKEDSSDLKNNKHSRLLDDSVDTNDSSPSLKPALEENSKENITRNGEESHPEIPKYFFRKPSQNSGEVFRNLFDITEESDVNHSEIQQPNRILPFISQLTDQSVSDDNTDSRLDANNNDISLDSEDPLKMSLESDSDSDLNASRIPSGEVSGPAIPKNFFQMPAKDTGLAFRNMFDIDKKSDVDNPEESSLPRFLPHVPEISDQNDASDSLDSDNQESDLPLELNRPISETKIAVPGPLDLIRRFTMGRQPDNEGNSEMEQHDRRFFLAQALERLRSLDVGNILPSSRQKTNSETAQKQKFVPKVQSEQEVVTERSSYLQKLRNRLFQ